MFGLFSQRAHALIAGLAGAVGIGATVGRRNGTHGSTRVRRHRSLKAKAGAR